MIRKISLPTSCLPSEYILKEILNLNCQEICFSKLNRSCFFKICEFVSGIIMNMSRHDSVYISGLADNHIVMTPDQGYEAIIY